MLLGMAVEDRKVEGEWEMTHISVDVLPEHTRNDLFHHAPAGALFISPYDENDHGRNI